MKRGSALRRLLKRHPGAGRHKRWFAWKRDSAGRPRVVDARGRLGGLVPEDSLLWDKDGEPIGPDGRRTS